MGIPMHGCGTPAEQGQGMGTTNMRRDDCNLDQVRCLQV